jgi:hypothetical protein
MIKIYKVTNESRIRDIPRNRYILEIGDMAYHITREEAESLQRQLNRLIKKRRSK